MSARGSKINVLERDEKAVAMRYGASGRCRKFLPENISAAVSSRQKGLVMFKGAADAIDENNFQRHSSLL
jgi:hypothetical protein